MGRKPTAKRALPASFSDKSTKSGGGKVIKKSNVGTRKTSGDTKGVKGVLPGKTFKPSTVLKTKKK